MYLIINLCQFYERFVIIIQLFCELQELDFLFIVESLIIDIVVFVVFVLIVFGSCVVILIIYIRYMYVLLCICVLY